MFRTRIFKIGSLAAFVAGAPGCGGDAPASNVATEVDPEIGVVMDGLGTAVAACNDEGVVPESTGAHDPVAKTLAMTLEGGSAVFSVVGTALTVNGWPCYDDEGVAMTTSNVKKLNITSATGSADKVVFDLMAGSFGSIFSTSGGVTVALANAGDEFHVRGSAGNNSMKMGESGAAVYIEASGDTKADIKVSGNVPSEMTFALGAGNDTFTADAVTAISAAHIDSAVTSLSKLTLVDLTIYGGDGNDTLTGGNGDDVLYGGNDNDTLLAGATGDGVDEFWGGSGIDTVSYAAREASVLVDINPGIFGTTGTIDLASLTYPIAGESVVSVNCDSGAELVDLDTLASAEAIRAALDATDCTATIDSMNRLVLSDDVSVTIANGDGDGADALGLAVGLHDGDDADDGEASEGDDVREDVENLIGGSGDDELVGNDMANVITGGNGDDVISGGIAGDCDNDIDVLNGGNDDDVFMMGPASDCGDTVNGGAGFDRADYQYRTEDLVITVNNAADDGEDEDDNIKNDVEQIFGGFGGDTITGGAAAEDLRGGAGDDILSGGGGNDTLVGHAGDDTLNGDAGDDIFLNDGEDTDYVTHSTAQRTRGAGDDVMNGGAGTLDKADYDGRTAALGITMCVDTAALQGASSLTGVCADIDGTMDAPVLTGDANISGGMLSDGDLTITFKGVTYPVSWSNLDAATVVRDAINTALGDVGLTASVSGNFMVLTPDLAPGDLSVTVAGTDPDDVFGTELTTTSAAEGDSVVNIEWVIGSDDATNGDVIVGGAVAETIEGRAGPDTINAGAGNDTIYGDDGIDALWGEAGDDYIDGGAGADVTDGGDGDGDLCPDDGADTITTCEIE